LDIARFFYKLHLVDESLQPQRFIGTAFPVAPNGGLLTCRHVVDIAVPDGQVIAVFDSEMSRYVMASSKPVYPADGAVDLAFLPNALGRPKPQFLPMLSPPSLKIGEDVYTFGFFAIGANQESLEQGYFAGRIVNFFNYEESDEQARMTLPFPVLEGMSGSPILTYHNGPKVVGIGIGNRQTRILASEVIEFREDNAEFREGINRIVDYGVAHHPTAIVKFLMRAGVHDIVVSDARIAVPNLE
jgi:trypsin-like peptidase